MRHNRDIFTSALKPLRRPQISQRGIPDREFHTTPLLPDNSLISHRLPVQLLLLSQAS
jgi:hypothetical protein